DRNGDGKLSEAEISAYLDLQMKAQASQLVLTLADRNRSLFELIDADHDGRLGIREVRSMWQRLAEWDRDGDDCLSRKEIPYQFQLTVSQGQHSFADEVQSAPGYGPAARSKLPLLGPAWFRKMDRNNDGDVSRREFLGPLEEFERIDANGDG